MTEEQVDLVRNLALWGSMSQRERDALGALLAVVKNGGAGNTIVAGPTTVAIAGQANEEVALQDAA